MKKTTFKNTIKLFVICIVVLIFMQIVSIIIYTSMTEKKLTLHISDYVKSHYNISKENFYLTYAQFSSPFPAKILDVFAQGIVLLLVGFLIDKRKIYNRKYWILALLLTQLEHNMSNSNISFTPDVAVRAIMIFGAMLVGYIALFASIKIVKKRTNLSPDQP